MKIDILTLFPDLFSSVFSESIIKRAQDLEKVTIRLINFRDYSKASHHKVDDAPFGGGCGMVLSCQPIFDCIEDIRTEKSKIILLTPDGVTYNQKIAYDLSKEEHLIFICGHYEGFDERIRSLASLELSIGDYILTGGEYASIILVDSIVRLLPGVIKEESHRFESFNNHLLDYPSYTKPRVYRGMAVPEVLFSGNHQKIAEYRKKAQIERTMERRPDLLRKVSGSDEL